MAGVPAVPNVPNPHMVVPDNAREVYCNEAGEPIAYCPKDSLGVTDLQRAQFYLLNMERLAQLAVRAKEKTAQVGEEQVVVCIDVDDLRWTFLVDLLMPGHDWAAIRSRGEHPVARGVVPRAPMADIVERFYPAAGALADGLTNILVFAAGGVSIIPAQETP